MLKVLAIDDQPAVLEALRVLFEIHDVPFLATGDAGEALALVERGDVGVVIQDMNFRPGATGGEEGVALFRRLRAVDGDLPILLVTAWTSLETAVELVKEGAADYLAKPWDDKKLLADVRQLLDARRKAGARDAGPPGDLVYASAAMERVVALAESVAGSAVPILISGPNGAGKERIADLIHAASPRRDGPFVKVNVGALPVELMEAELFGAEAGAYTGREDLRKGRFETARGGTLFLDEIDSLSRAGQVKLLRVLETGEFSRLGSSETLRADVRVLSASNADLKEAIADGRLREDLYYRLNVVEVRVPALAERPEDVLPLAEHFLRQFAEGKPKELSDEGRRALLAHDWPGNVRELRNAVQRAALVAEGELITAVDLAVDVRSPQGDGDRVSPADAPPADLDPDEIGERRRLETALRQAGGNVSRAAADLGLSRQALYRRMARLGLTVERRLR